MRYPATELPGTSECQNCGKVYDNEDLLGIEDYSMRVAPGEIAPSGECPDPDCGALCHLKSTEEVQ